MMSGMLQNNPGEGDSGEAACIREQDKTDQELMAAEGGWVGVSNSLLTTFLYAWSLS